MVKDSELLCLVRCGRVYAHDLVHLTLVYWVDLPITSSPLSLILLQSLIFCKPFVGLAWVMGGIPLQSALASPETLLLHSLLSGLR